MSLFHDSENNFDLRSGTVDNQLVLDGAVRTRQGRQIGGVAFPGNQLNVLQMAEIDQTQTFYLVHRDLFQSSFLDLKSLFERKTKNPFLFFKIDDLLGMEKPEFESNLQNLSVEIKIHRIVKDTFCEDEISSGGACHNRLNGTSTLEGELQNFLRQAVADKSRKPEETLEKAIKIIRSQPR